MSGMRVTPVRRTVAVAVALVTAQALLCGVIGFVTFDDRGDATAGARAAGPQIFMPPTAAPSVSTAPPAASALSGRRAIRPPAATSNPASRPPSSAVSGPPPPAPPASPPAPSTIAIPPAPPPEGLAPSSAPPPEDEEIEAPVRLGSRCDKEGAFGRTAEGEIVRCLRGRHGDLRWRLE